MSINAYLQIWEKSKPTKQIRGIVNIKLLINAKKTTLIRRDTGDWPHSGLVVNRQKKGKLELATVTLRSKRVKMAIGLGVHHAISA